MSHRLPSFFSANPDIDLDLVTTQNFLSLEPGIHPDIFITKMSRIRDGYISTPRFHDRIYPVCTPSYLSEHPEIRSLEGLRDGVLLNLSPHGRSQVAEHVDWSVWLAVHLLDIEDRLKNGAHYFNANDYNLRSPGRPFHRQGPADQAGRAGVGAGRDPPLLRLSRRQGRRRCLEPLPRLVLRAKRRIGVTCRAISEALDAKPPV
jgi:DNA-binding transcriptional LysR family regulator